jgi:predicted transcriptional regulator
VEENGKLCYRLDMNAKLKDIIERADTWPEEAQEEAVQFLLALEQEYAEPYELSDEDRKAIDRGLEDMRQGRFATDEQVAAVFNRYRRR